MKCEKCGWLYGFHDPTCGKEFAQPGFGPTPFQILGPDGKPFQAVFPMLPYADVEAFTSTAEDWKHWPPVPTWWGADYAKVEKDFDEFLDRTNDKALARIGRAFERALAEAAR